MSIKSKTLSDTQIVEWLLKNLDWGGAGYWLPDVSIKSIEADARFCEVPTMEEFRKALSERANNA